MEKDNTREELVKSLCEIKEKYKLFVIPDMQRDYVWNETQWEQLWTDICRIYSSEIQEQHFMGRLVLKHETNEYAVIDGQQRLTTIKILLDYLYDLKRYTGEEVDDSSYIEISNANAIKVKGLIEDCQCNNKDKYARAYNFFANQYYKLGMNIDIEHFISIIEHRLLFVVSEIENNDNEYRLFDAINATGKPLVFADLILNYLCEHAGQVDNKEIKCRWFSILNSIANNIILPSEPEVDATTPDDEEETVEPEPETEFYDEADEGSTEEVADESNTIIEAEINSANISPLKLKKFLNAIHCLTLPRTESMPESIDAFEQVFVRINNSFYNGEKIVDSVFILNELEKWKNYYISYLSPAKEDCTELKLLSTLASTNLIPVVMRILQKYENSESDRKNVLSGIICCQIMKSVYVERDNLRRLDKVSILADYIYDFSKNNDDVNKYFAYLVNTNKLKDKLERDSSCINCKKYDEVELWKVPYNKRVGKFLLMFSEKQISENLDDYYVDYLISPENRNSNGRPVYIDYKYDGKTISELWNTVLKRKSNNGDSAQEVCRLSDENVNRLKSVYEAISNYCNEVLKNVPQIENIEEGFFVKYSFENNLFSSVSHCKLTCEEAEANTQKQNCYFGFKKKDDKLIYCIFPKGYFGNNNTIGYFMNGDKIGEENDKASALTLLLKGMIEASGDKNSILAIITKIGKVEKPSNVLFLSKEIKEGYDNLPESTKERWEKYLNEANGEDIVVNINTGVEVITKSGRSLYQKYIEQYPDKPIGFWLMMRRPEMHFVKGRRLLTQYRNIGDQEIYEEFVLKKEQVLQHSEMITHCTNNTAGGCEDRMLSCSYQEFSELMSRNYLIPEYQRGYVWNEKNWKTLIHSLEDSKGNGILELGMLVLYKIRNSYSIVDGQQRLTTLFQLLNALKSTKIESLPKQEKCSRYMEKYCTSLSESEKSELLETIKKISFCVLTINEKADMNYQYRVFSAINGKGIKLSTEEKVKNFLLEKMGIIDKVRKQLPSIANEKGFIKAYTEMKKREHVSENDMYETFKECISTEKYDFEKLNSVYEYYKLLKKGNVFPKAKRDDIDSDIKELWIWLKLYQHIKVDTADALILDILTRKVSNITGFKNLQKAGNNAVEIRCAKELIKSIDMIFFLLYIDDISGNGKKSINSKFPKMISSDRISIDMNICGKAINDVIDDKALYNLGNNEEDIFDYLWNKISSTDLTRTMRVAVSRFILVLLEWWNGLDEDTIFSLLVDKNKNMQALACYDIEHIFPANPDDEFAALDRPEYLYTLQNVCLLESNINRKPAVSNGMMVVAKKNGAKAKLGYIDKNDKLDVTGKYYDSKLGFPRMFYEAETVSDKYVDFASNDLSVRYYSEKCAQIRCKAIRDNIKSKHIMIDMIKPILEKVEIEQSIDKPPKL